MSKKLNTVTGPSGIDMAEETAHAIERVAKKLPADFTFRRMSRVAKDFQFGSLEDGSRTEISVVTTDDVDRDSEVVIPKGIELGEFLKSPTVFYAHKYDQPVGKALWIKEKGNGLSAMTKYAQKPAGWEGPWLPDACFSMMQEGIGIGKSIGFIPLNIREATREEISKRPDWKDAAVVIDKALLLEFSVAPLACNPNALTMAVSKSLASGAIDSATADFLTNSLTPKSIVEPPPSCYKCKGEMKSTKPDCFACQKCGVEYSTKTESPIVVTDKTVTDAAAGDVVDDDDAMPDCPLCMSPENVTRKDEDGGMYACSMCGEEFSKDDSGRKSVKSLTLNSACVTRAKVLIGEGKVNHGEWSAPVGSERKSEDCLAIDSGATDAAKYKYPIIKGGELYSRAVGNAAARAEQNGASAVAGAAKNLSEKIAEHGDKKYIDAPHMSAEACADSIRREYQRTAIKVVEDARQSIADVLTLAKGG